MVENKNLSISKEDLELLYKYTMDKKTSIGFWLCQEREFLNEIWDEVKPIYKRYLDKNISESLIDRHVLCNLDFLMGSIDMMYPYINEDDDIYNFINDTYNSFLAHDNHNIKEKWENCIKNNTWHPEAWKRLYEDTINYFTNSVNEPYLSKDYCAIVNLIAKTSQDESFDKTLNFNRNRDPFYLHEYKYYENPTAAYMTLFNRLEYIIESKEENDRIKWYD